MNTRNHLGTQVNAIESFLALLYGNRVVRSSPIWHTISNVMQMTIYVGFRTPRMNSTKCHEFKLEMSKMTHIGLGISVPEGSNWWWSIYVRTAFWREEYTKTTAAIRTLMKYGALHGTALEEFSTWQRLFRKGIINTNISMIVWTFYVQI